MFKETVIKAELIERIQWLIRLRWIAIVGLFIVSYVASNVFYVVTWVTPLYVIGILLALSNLVFMLYAGVLKTKDYYSVQRCAGVQIMWDLFSLMSLIYFAGGAWNPFILYILFHVIIAAILLEKRYSYLQAFFATVLLALMLALEYYSVIPHQPLKISSTVSFDNEYWHYEVYILSMFFAISSTIFISVYFVTSIMDRLKKSRGEIYFEIKSTLENMAEGVIFIDAEDKITMCNNEIEKTWNVKREEIINKSINDSFIPFLGEEVVKIIEGFKNGGSTSQHQEEKVESGYLYNTYTAIFDNDDKYWGTVLTSHDISERKKLENKLSHAKRLATIGEMSAKIAHEIRNPLSSISLNAELLHDEIESYKDSKKDEAEELIQSILDEVERLTEISEEYLKSARFPKLELSETSINDLLRDLTKFLREEMIQGDIVLTEKYGKLIPEIFLDRKQVKQAFVNFFRNSFQAMPDGGKMSISTRYTGKNIEIIITDSGAGISKSDVQKIFDPFYSTKVTGTGLGLALTLKTIEEHCGEIFCKSTLGVGTTMKVLFPITQKKGR
ncbi:MAG: PAS domain S-box protein [Planctomycetes bacterium]|nr:PAS domain S-box protein [Planctomycetota bacterium]